MPKILEKCVADVMAKGHSEEQATTIVRAAFNIHPTWTEERIEAFALELSDALKKGKFALPATKNIDGVEIFAAGKWNGDTYTEADLDGLVSAFAATKEMMKPYLKLGHSENQALAQEDGMPSLGWIENLRRTGTKLVADFKGVPQKIYDLMKARAYRRVSSEIFMNIEVVGKKYSKLLKAVSILGGDTPAVQTLDDIMALYASASEVRSYGEGIESRAYMFEIKKEEDDEMDRIKELETELASTKTDLSAALEKVKVFEADAAKVKEYEAKVKTLEGSVETLSGELKKLTATNNAAKATAEVDKLVREKKILPAQREEAFTMLVEALAEPGEKKYKVGEAEVSKFEYVAAFFAKGKADVKTEEGSGAGSRQTDDLDVKATEFIAKEAKEGRKVSYSEALIAVTPKEGMPSTEVAE